MTRDETISLARMQSLGNTLVQILNDDIDSAGKGFDPYDHLTLLSLLGAHAAVKLGLSKDDFMRGVGNSYDEAVEEFKQQGFEYEEHNHAVNN